MATIPLTQGKMALIDDEDLERCLAHKWCAFQPKRRPGAWYAVTGIRKPDGRKTTMALHRFLMGNPKGMDVDHRDGDGLNNRRLNIRVATRSQNIANQVRRSHGKSRYKGVSKTTGGKYFSYIKPKQEYIYLGVFSSEREAAQAYDCAAVLHFGAFASLNFGRVRPLNNPLVYRA